MVVINFAGLVHRGVGGSPRLVQHARGGRCYRLQYYHDTIHKLFCFCCCPACCVVWCDRLVVLDIMRAEGEFSFSSVLDVHFSGSMLFSLLNLYTQNIVEKNYENFETVFANRT